LHRERQFWCTPGRSTRSARSRVRGLERLDAAAVAQPERIRPSGCVMSTRPCTQRLPSVSCSATGHVVAQRAHPGPDRLVTHTGARSDRSRWTGAPGRRGQAVPGRVVDVEPERVGVGDLVEVLGVAGRVWINVGSRKVGTAPVRLPRDRSRSGARASGLAGSRVFRPTPVAHVVSRPPASATG